MGTRTRKKHALAPTSTATSTATSTIKANGQRPPTNDHRPTTNERPTTNDLTHCTHRTYLTYPTCVLYCTCPHSGEIIKASGRIGAAQILGEGPKPRQRAPPTKGMSVSKARERAAQIEAEMAVPPPPPAKKVVANASMRRFRTAREMQMQIDSIQQELDATKDYYAEVMTALQVEQERVDFQDEKLVSQYTLRYNIHLHYLHYLHYLRYLRYLRYLHYR